MHDLIISIVIGLDSAISLELVNLSLKMECGQVFKCKRFLEYDNIYSQNPLISTVMDRG